MRTRSVICSWPCSRLSICCVKMCRMNVLSKTDLDLFKQSEGFLRGCRLVVFGKQETESVATRVVISGKCQPYNLLSAAG